MLEIHDALVRQQVRPLLLPAVDGPLLEFHMDADVGDVGQPTSDLQVGRLGIDISPGAVNRALSGTQKLERR